MVVFNALKIEVFIADTAGDLLYLCVVFYYGIKSVPISSDLVRLFSVQLQMSKFSFNFSECLILVNKALIEFSSPLFAKVSFFDLVSYLQEVDIWQVSYAQLQMYEKLKCLLKKRFAV